MASTSENIVDTLQELTEFINDRREGYERALRESKNSEFQAYYRRLSSQSADFANELNSHIRSYGGDPERDTTIKGKFYRQWMDVKAAFTGSDEKAIIDSNIYGEEWALKAYDDALNSGTLPPEIRQAVDRQKAASLKAYNELKSMKDLGDSYRYNANNATDTDSSSFNNLNTPGFSATGDAAL